MKEWEVRRVNALFQEIDDLKEQLDAANKQLQWNRSERKTLEQRIQQLERKLNDRDRWSHVPDERLIRVERLLEQLCSNSIEQLLSNTEPREKQGEL